MIPVLYVDDNSDLLTIGKRYLEILLKRLLVN